MKLHFEKITPAAGTPLVVQRVVEEAFTGPLHFHPELELTLIVRSGGQRYVGDSLEAFEAGDVVLLGENLPHRWASPPPAAPGEPAEAVVVQFGADVATADWWQRAGGQHVAQLLHESRRGLCLLGATREAAAQVLQTLPELPAFEQVLALLGLLSQVARSGDYRPLSSPSFRVPLRQEDSRRLNQVYGYIYETLTTGPDLGTAAAALHLSPSAFCHYFRKHTQKTFSQVVNEARVGQAQQLLMTTDRPVADVGYACGFNSLSNFNKQFARVVGCAPTRFRRRYQ